MKNIRGKENNNTKAWRKEKKKVFWNGEKFGMFILRWWGHT